MDVSGAILLVDREDEQGRLARPAILPNGYLALGSHYGDTLLLLDMGLTPPDDTSDLVIRVGERRFHCHRLILSTRCDYFKQRLAAGGGFADARAAELELPDADADAFALLLRWLYTGGAAIPPALALAVAELADRLLLPELCLAAQGRLMSGVQPSTIATALLWADARAPASVRLRVELKAWYVAHYTEVRRVAPEGIMRIMMASPALALELMDATHEAARQQHK
eukprot:XP_001698681.1 predicted protein [Chlamydomonas reinhardtii]